MKKQLINEAFRLQQIAGIKPINEINGELEKFLDAIYDTLNDEMRLGNFTEQSLRRADMYMQKNGENLFNSGRSPRDIADDLISKSNTGKGLQKEEVGSKTFYISKVSSNGTDCYCNEESFNSYEECLISVIEDGGGDADDFDPEEHDIDFLEEKLGELIEEHNGEWTVCSIIGKNEGILYVGP